jgi:2,5-furandicarboxylate decarboxylase 1
MNKPYSAVEALDLERFSLSRLIEHASAEGEVEIVAERVELADLAARLDGNLKAVLFTDAGPEGARVVGNLAASRKRIALAFGTSPDRVVQEALSRLRRPQPVVEVERAKAPVQEIVQIGEEADLTALPVHLQHGLDGAPYISAGLDFVRDPTTGLVNSGMRRLMLRGRREAGIDLVAPSDLRAIYEGSARRNEPLPIAFAVGSTPIDHLASVFRLPGDDLELMAALRGAPLPVVKCITSDLRVPADAEYILEGYLDPAGHVEPEGPYGEFLGYYGGVKPNPVFHLTAITRRRQAIFQTSTIGGRFMAATDTALLIALRTEVTMWKVLENAVREPVAVYATPSSGGSFNVRIALRQRVPGEARNAIAAAFSSFLNVKHVFVVDPDIDVASDAQVDWALATRFQADRDLVVQTGMRTLSLDPSLQGAVVGAKAGFDCTLPLNHAGSIHSRIPEPPRYDGERFPSLEAALEHGPKTFAQLMAAAGSRDGREIVRQLEELRRRNRLGREPDGRWSMTAATV